MKKTGLTFITVVLGLLLAFQAFAWSPGHGKGREYRPCREAGMEQLNLSDAQKAKIEALRDAYYKATKPLREKIFDKSVELRRMWLQTNPDKNKIAAAQKELRTMRDTLEDQSTAHRLAIHQTLTAEQKEKLANSGWGKGPGFGPRGRMGDHDGFGPGHGPGPGLGMGMCQ